MTPRNAYLKGRLSTIDLLIKVADFVKETKKCLLYQKELKLALVKTKRSSELSLPLKKGFPDNVNIIRLFSSLTVGMSKLERLSPPNIFKV
jgi:hypothetical protein